MASLVKEGYGVENFKNLLHTSKDISRGTVLGCDTTQYYCHITKIWRTYCLLLQDSFGSDTLISR